MLLGLLGVGLLATDHLGPTGALVAGTAYGLVVAIVLTAVARDRSRAGLGPADRVTLARAAVVSLVAGLGVQGGSRPETAWVLVALATLAMVLDGVDGAVARARGAASQFGARFDQELDAALILVLGVALVRGDRLGPWVLGLGLARYGWLAAGRVVPALRGDLPPSLARKTVAVVQGVTLVVASAPIVPRPLAATGCLGAGLALSWSFGRDTATLLRAR